MAMSPPASKPLVFSAQVGILGTYVTIDSNLPSSRFGCRLGLFFFAVCLRWIFVFLSFRFVSFRFVLFLGQLIASLGNYNAVLKTYLDHFDQGNGSSSGGNVFLPFGIET